jgi:hypothetical protein
MQADAPAAKEKENPSAADNPSEKIRQLHGLMEDGILSEEEYNEKKEELLDSY